LAFGIIDSNASRPLRRVNIRINDRNLTLESLVREGRKAHIDPLPSLQETDLVFVKTLPKPKDWIGRGRLLICHPSSHSFPTAHHFTYHAVERRPEDQLIGRFSAFSRAQQFLITHIPKLEPAFGSVDHLIVRNPARTTTIAII